MKFNTSLAEFYCRQQKLKKMNRFKANYYIDSVSIWEAMPPQGKVIRVALCSSAARAKKKLARFVSRLAKELNIAFSYIKVRLGDKELEDIIYAAAENIGVPKGDFSLQEYSKGAASEEEAIVPTIDKELLIANNWGAADNIHPISSIKLSSNVGDIFYRVWSGGTWSPWIGDNQSCGHGSIEGFQLEFSSTYQLLYRCNLQGRGWTPWKSRSPNLPYQIPILDIEFKFQEGE